MCIGTYAPKVFDSPLTPFSTLAPLCVVLCFSMCKEAFEDYKRHLADRRTDDRLTLASASLDGSFAPIRWGDVKVGMVIRLHGGEAVPADCVVLRSSHADGTSCHVETSNIDGETNLKTKRAVVGLPSPTPLFTLVAEPPSGNVHQFRAYCTLSSDAVLAVDETSFLLRGSSVQNVSHVDGLVVYTGLDSRLARNASKPRLKLSSVEKTMNRLIRMVFAWLFTMVTVCTVALVIFRAKHQEELNAYLKGSGETFSLPLPVATWLTFLILFSNALPMSLYVTVEMVNFGQAFFVGQDLQMYDEASDTPARAVTSNLNSDLGQVEYLFSDKTGTLTKNVMTFKRCSVDGTLFGPPLAEDDEEGLPSFEPLSALARHGDFVTCLAVAHTVMMENGEMHAESPDELALCQGAAQLGYVFASRDTDELVVEINGAPTAFTVLAVNAFTSTRKRMSVLVKLPGGAGHRLLCKGADTAMFPRLTDFASSGVLGAHLQMFADEGLRTLIIAHRPMTAAQAEEWLRQFRAAKASVDDRDALLEAAADAIETELVLLGATAIEDELQDGVGETLEALREAGIKVWVLTGDKLETAVNIGFSARLLDPRMRLMRVDGETANVVREQLLTVPARASPKAVAAGGGTFRSADSERWTRAASWWGHVDDDLEQGLLRHDGGSSTSAAATAARRDEDEEMVAMAITGAALEIALVNDALKQDLLKAALACRVVVACRVSPRQKADVVRLVKRGAQSESGATPVTLAIGDGANDVSMIQEAQVGVGISGREGLQAVNASDFAIAQFRFLKPLLLVHGRWSYRRMAKVVLYSLYKNLVLVLILLYFQAFSAFSGVSLFEAMVQAGYNFFLGMGPLAMGLFDREISAQFAMANPPTYVSGRRNLNLNPVKLGWRVVEAFVHSIVCFAFPLAVAAGNGLQSDTLGHSRKDAHGGSSDMYVLGLVTYTCLFFVMQYKILFEASSCTNYNLAAWFFSAGLYFSFLCAYNWLLGEAPEFFDVAFMTLSRPVLWLLVVLCIGACFAFDASVRLARTQLRPHPVDILIERDRLVLHAQETREAENGLSHSPSLRSTIRRGIMAARDLLAPNRVELARRVASLTEADLARYGLERSSYDFSLASRLPLSGPSMDSVHSLSAPAAAGGD